METGTSRAPPTRDRGRQRLLPKPTTSRPPALHLQPYSSVSVWRGTEGGGVDAHRKRHLNQDYPKPGNKRKGAYGCCLDLFVSRYTSEIANCENFWRKPLRRYLRWTPERKPGRFRLHLSKSCYDCHCRWRRPIATGRSRGPNRVSGHRRCEL